MLNFNDLVRFVNFDFKCNCVELMDDEWYDANNIDDFIKEVKYVINFYESEVNHFTYLVEGDPENKYWNTELKRAKKDLKDNNLLLKRVKEYKTLRESK